MPKTSHVIQTFALLTAMTMLASGYKTLEARASESYEYWRIRTGGTSVAAFYTENGLQETCHGFWAKDYRETDPNSPCFNGTTNSGTVETLAVFSSDDREGALEVADRLSGLLDQGAPLVGTLGPVVGAHAGPRAIGVTVITRQPD